MPAEPTEQAIARLESAIPAAILDAVPGLDLGGPVTVERRNVPSSETGDGGLFPAIRYRGLLRGEVWPHGERAVIQGRTGIWLDRTDGSSIGVSEESTADRLLTDDELMAIALDPRVSFYR